MMIAPHMFLFLIVMALLCITGSSSSFDESFSATTRNLEEETTGKPWGEVIGASLLVNLATLIGVIFFCSYDRCRNNTESKRGNFKDIMIPSFAAGALFATVFFLTLPESISQIQTSVIEGMEAEHAHAEEEGLAEEEEDHGAEMLVPVTWRLGASILGGFLLPLVFSIIFPHIHVDNVDEDDKDDKAEKETDEESQDDEVAVKTETINKSLALSILLGDALHNFCDGVFIGVAFSLCDTATALTIMAVTLYHEIAQELADFFLLTRHAGFTKTRALLYNFLSGLSVMLGGIIVLSTEMSEMSIGVLLALASGVYLHIAACECMPRVINIVSNSSERLLLLVMFAVGAVPISLTLLNHTHCEAHSH